MAAVAAVAAVAGLLALSHTVRVPAIAPTAPITLRATFDPSSVEFGDRMTAEVVIEMDRADVRPATLRFTDGLAPLTQLGPTRTSRLVRGDLELLIASVPVACVTQPCVARSSVTTLAFPPVRASVSTRSGRLESISSRWPDLDVRGRVLASDLAPAQPPFAADTSPVAPAYRIAPATLATLLDALAVVCVLGAVALGAWQAVLFARRRPARRVGALERALRLAREAESLPPPARRRALELLARLLGRDELSSLASELAWSEPQPQPSDVEALVSEIEQRQSG